MTIGTMTIGDRVTLKPRAGGRVRKPDTTPLAADGEEVIVDLYWLRLLGFGDVEPADAAPVEPTEDRLQPDADAPKGDAA